MLMEAKAKGLMEFTPQEILSGLLEKRADVFRYLYKAYGPMIAGYIRKNSGTEEDVAEMIQVVMLELWVAVRDGRYQEEGKLGQYLYQLSSNTWRDELRKRRNRPQQSLSDSDLQIEDESDENLASAIVKDRYLNAVHEGMAQLGEVCRDIIQMYHLQKIRLQEIAERLEYDYDNLRKRIFDCRKKLKQLTENILAKDVQE
jgi:RNA polymerase sigma factor (sigma-70 family)